MITTIILLIILIKLISFKGFLLFLSVYSGLYLVIKFLKDESSSIYQMHMNMHIKQHKQKILRSSKGGNIHEKKFSSGQKGTQNDIKNEGKNKFIKSTTTVKKIIVKKTFSSSKDVLIIKKSKIMKTKKIVTIKPALI